MSPLSQATVLETVTTEQ